MGAKDSKPCFLSYEDAVKRVTDAELKRLKDAFKRSSTLTGHMPKNVFIREVLGEGVPQRLAEHIYTAFGGTIKGLTYKDLTCGLVLLTRGKQEEKIKFIFGLYANESLSNVQKEQMDKMVLATEGMVPQSLSQLFLESDKVNYDHFREWLINHPDSTTLTKWLLKEPCSVTLSNDSETPTFYQTLAGVTHLEEADILELEKRYWVLKGQSKTGRFDLETFKPMVCPPIPESLCEGVFNAFDENRDNHIDFKEIACGISACCRGPLVERLKFCFKIFDTNCDGLLSKEDLVTMIGALLEIRRDNQTQADWVHDKFREIEPKILVEDILLKFDSNKDGMLSLDEYLLWSSEHPLPQDFLDLLFQVSHVVLGLKPGSPEEEEKVILGWVERETRHGLQLHSTWYLVAMQWWSEWRDYVTYSSKIQRQQKNMTAAVNHHQSNSYPNSPSPSSNRRSATLPRKQKKNSLNPNFNTGNYTWQDDSDVVVTNYNYKTDLSPKPNGVAGRSNSLPRNGNSGVILNPRELSATSSPSASPRLGRKYSGIPPRPGQIDNSPLIMPNTYKVATLTNEGGRLKRNVPLVRGRDYELLPEPVWKALCSWYGGSPALPRTVISMSPNLQPDLELYSITTKLLRHQIPAQRPNTTTTFTGMMTGLGGMALNVAGLGPPATPRRYLAYTACFSRKHTLKQVSEYLCSRLRIGKEDMRLWKFKDEQNMILLEDEEMTMEELNVEEQQQILIEVRNKDLTWPEEMSSLVKNKTAGDKRQQAPTTQGATGLNNLGNTCFMNSAVQCVSNTRALTEYFRHGKHLYELNRDNPLGMKGHIAQRYGDLVKNLWTGTSKTIAPLKLRWTIGKYAPRFNGFQQHDAQELLAFLLDGLHEDLNRVHNKPYVELKDSDGRPDEVVAREAWDNHLVRNKSIVVDLFHGQLKSQVRCMACGHISVRFDPFTYLSLPLPMESCIHLEIIVICRDGSVPVKYGVRLNMDEKYRLLKKQLSELSGIPQQQLLLVELIGAVVKSFPHDSQKIRSALSGSLYAYELPPVPEIPPMSAMEEKVLSKEQMALRDIQRMTSVNSKDTSHKENGDVHRSEVIKSMESENGMGDAVREPPHITVNGTENVSDGLAANNLGHSRNASNCSMSSSITNNNNGALGPDPEISGFLVAVHRKMIRMDVYFLSSQKTRPSLFGTPLIIPCHQDTTHQDLYQSVWVQVSRLVSPLPPSESGHSNHAQDCDDSLGYEYPFTLKAVQKDGFTCAWCPWYRFCRGCKLDCTTEEFNNGSCYIAVDWEPTALHLRYQSSQERVYNDHESVEESRRLQTEPIDLDACLRAFTKEEELGEEELYYCSKCKELRLAAKKLDIWKLPPILIIHLKRFQFLNNRWVKSHKIVKFPVKHFDPSSYLAPRTYRPDVGSKIIEVQEANYSEMPDSNEAANCQCPEEYETCNCGNESWQSGGEERPIINGDLSDIDGEEKPSESCHDPFTNGSTTHGLTHSRSLYDNLPETEGATAAMELDDVLDDDNPSVSGRHRMTSVASMDYTTARYDLYALSCHSGILGGGHYVSYAKNPNKKWYCYNDSSCKEITEDQIDTDSAYMLFYERRDLDYNRYLPNIQGKVPCVEEEDEEFESDFKKMCSLQ